MIRESVLRCGVRVLTECIPTVRSVTVGIFADVGSAAEPPKLRGISHLLEHMLFKGTARRSARRIAEEIDAVGGFLNAVTDKESTLFYAQVVDRHLEVAVDVLADMFLHATLDEQELRKERAVVAEEIRMYDDVPEETLGDLFARTLWPGANLGDPVVGFVETVESIERDALVAWKRARYAPSSVLVAAAGNLEHDAFAALAEEAFTGFAGVATPPGAERPAFVPDLCVRRDDTEQVYLMLGMPGMGMRDERRYALAVLDSLLGGGASSRLFQAVREERGLAYEIGSLQQSYREAGLFGISAATSPERVQPCLDVIVGELDRLLEYGASADEVARAREHLKGAMILVLESTSNRMTRLVRNASVYGRQIATEEIEAAFDAVDVGAVDALARELLAPARRGLCVLGPVDEDRIRFARPYAA